jgi:hypothetical protein
VAGGKDKSIAVQPLRVLRVVLKMLSPKLSTNFCTTKRKAHVSRVALLQRDVVKIQIDEGKTNVKNIINIHISAWKQINKNASSKLKDIFCFCVKLTDGKRTKGP